MTYFATHPKGCGKLIRKTNNRIDDFICGISYLLCKECRVLQKEVKKK